MDAQTGTWIGLASLFIMSLFAWLNKRDSLRNDTETAALRTQNATQAGQIADLKAAQKTCDDGQRETARKLDECEEKHETTELRLKDVEAAVARLNTIK